MKIIKSFYMPSELLQTLCGGTPGGLLLLYGDIVPVNHWIPVYHITRTDETHFDVDSMYKELDENFDYITQWGICQFQHLFLLGSYSEEEIEYIKKLSIKYKDNFEITTCQQVIDKEIQNKFIIEEV